MKTILKKLKINPAFKQRQILPLLAGGRAGGGAKETAKADVVPPAPTPVTPPTWVTTE